MDNNITLKHKILNREFVEQEMRSRMQTNPKLSNESKDVMQNKRINNVHVIQEQTKTKIQSNFIQTKPKLTENLISERRKTLISSNNQLKQLQNSNKFVINEHTSKTHVNYTKENKSETQTKPKSNRI